MPRKKIGSVKTYKMYDEVYVAFKEFCRENKIEPSTKVRNLVTQFTIEQVRKKLLEERKI